MLTSAKQWLFLFFFFCGFIFSQGVPVYYSAETLKIEFSKTGESEEVVLEGSVKVSFRDVTVRCENAKINRVTGDVTTEGPLSVETSQGTFQAEYMEYNLYEDCGILMNASFEVPPVYGKAGKFEKKKEVFLLSNGYITTCDIDRPHYKISADKIEYVADDYLKAEKMRLVLGEKYSILYLPGITFDAKTKQVPFSVRPGYSSVLGRAVELFFAHRLLDESDDILKEKISVSSKGLGGGLEISSKEKNYRAEGFFFRRLKVGEFEAGGLLELARTYISEKSSGNFIADWRRMSNNNFFYDFFHDDYNKKSKSFNYLSWTHNFGENVFNLNLRDSAGEDFLRIEKLPEIRFHTPSFRFDDDVPVFLENDLRLTNFYKDGEEFLRIADILSAEGRTDVGPYAIAPYLRIGGIRYYGDIEDKFNLLREAGIKVSASLKREHGDWDEYFIPSLSFLYRGLNYNKGEIEYLDSLENLNDGNFLNLGMNWFFYGLEGYMGKLSIDNSYDVTRENFEDTLMKYELKLTQQLYVSGENKWNFSENRYNFGANDLIFDSGKYLYSLGNEYDDESDISGVETRFGHLLNDNLRYGIGLNYDINGEGFSRARFDVWKKLHCWEVNVRVSTNKEDFSFFVTLYPIFL